VNQKKHTLSRRFRLLPVLMVLAAAPLAAQSEGTLRVSSEIAGQVLVDGVGTGVSVIAHRSVSVRDQRPGEADIAIMSDDGQVYPAARTVTIKPGQTTDVTINAGILWEINRHEDGAVITGYKGGPGTVAIPTVIDGLPVVGIEIKSGYNFGIFYEKNIRGVTIPSTIGHVIGDWAFAHGQLSDIAIPPNIDTIGGQAFYDNLLTRLTIPLSVTSIGERAFANNRLTGVSISSTVSFIGQGAFAGNQGLKEISVAAGNPAYTSIDGVLFSKDQTMLLAYPGGKGSQYTIPRKVTGIGDEAFAGSRLTAIDIPPNVTSIGERAFADNQLTDVTIPPKAGAIGRSAFAGNKVTRVAIGSNVGLSDSEEYPSFPNGFDAFYKNNNRRAGTYTYTGSAWNYRR
jgi:hypothetical protein